MKALIRSGLCLALGWLAGSAAAQEPTQWKPASHIVPASSSSTQSGRPTISLSQPTPLDTQAPAPVPERSFRVFPSTPPAVIRAQKADEKIFQIEPLPVTDDKKTPTQPTPKDKNFVPPPPTIAGPNPVPTVDGFGFGDTGCGDCDNSCCGMGGWGRFCKGVGGIFQNCCGRFGGCPDGSYRCWASAEYLFWWQKGQAVPPLITANPGGTPTAQTGLIGSAGVLYDSIPNRVSSGGRFALGTWFPHFCCNLGVEANFFFLGKQGSTRLFGSDGDPALSRPFFDTNGFQNAENFAINNATDIGSGYATVREYNQLWGVGANLRYKWWRGPNCWIDVLGGYRYLDLSEGIDITEFTQNVRVLGLNDVTRSFEQESFHTRNQFNGALFGLTGECRLWNRAFLGWTTNISMGNMHQIVMINGSTTYANNVNPLINGTQKGALLASTTNIGTYTANRFAVVPEIGIKLGYDVTDRFRVFVGYDFLYMSSVVRPGEQIDLNVNQAFRPVDGRTPGFGNQNPFGSGPRSPGVLFHRSDYWAQGLSAGFLYRF
jgi:hypothetical protein